MKLFLIERNKDFLHGMVIRAPDESEARRLAAKAGFIPSVETKFSELRVMGAAMVLHEYEGE